MVIINSFLQNNLRLNYPQSDPIPVENRFSISTTKLSLVEFKCQLILNVLSIQIIRVEWNIKTH